tara:strand:- start:1815 stop:2576 length:762 start_codon:yes stop_codon:yes gene_type:complete
MKYDLAKLMQDRLNDIRKIALTPDDLDDKENKDDPQGGSEYEEADRERQMEEYKKRKKMFPNLNPEDDPNMGVAPEHYREFIDDSKPIPSKSKKLFVLVPIFEGDWQGDMSRRRRVNWNIIKSLIANEGYRKPDEVVTIEEVTDMANNPEEGSNHDDFILDLDEGNYIKATKEYRDNEGNVAEVLKSEFQTLKEGKRVAVWMSMVLFRGGKVVKRKTIKFYNEGADINLDGKIDVKTESAIENYRLILKHIFS